MKYSEMFQVKPGEKFNLGQIVLALFPAVRTKHLKKKNLRIIMNACANCNIVSMPKGNGRCLSVCRALDSAGKDGTITHVLGAMDPQGTRVCGFKVPTLEEASHDFLWRIEKQVPSKGEVVIFNRSHYEDVLVVRVHKMVPEEVWSKRYNFINCFEQELVANGTHILKFYLHISPEEQLKRFQQRLDDPTRQWKISESDYEERGFWKEYTSSV